MKKYTIETLKDWNWTYHAKYGITADDVERVNQLVALIESTRSKEMPIVGDMVQYTSKWGDFYEHAHIEVVNDEKLYICEQPYVPFVEKVQENSGIITNTSGGAWTNIPKNIQYVGTADKFFKVWGHCGPCVDGAIVFEAKVSLWRYSDCEEQYTTELYDKYYVTVLETKSPIDYKYEVRKDGYATKAFRTDEEYEAWKKTFHAIEKESAFENTKIVWTFKQKQLCVPLEEYLQIQNAIVDTELMNGVVQECKRVVEGTTITTYLPYQHEKIEVNDEKPYRNAYKL